MPVTFLLCTLQILEKGPGTESVSMGTACVCWECGYVGLPKNMKACNTKHTVNGHCGACGETDRTNFIEVR